MQKKFKRLDNFFFEKGQNPSFLYTFYILLMWLLQKKGHVCLLKKVVPENTGHPSEWRFRYMKVHIFALRWKDEIRRSSQLRTLLKLVVVSRTWKKFQARTGFEPMTSAIPVQHWTSHAAEGKLFVNNSVPAFCKYSRVIYTDNLYSAEKYTRKFIHGHHLFLEAHSFLRVSLSENFASWNR